VQELVREVAEGLAEVLVVEREERGVLVRLAARLARVLLVDRADARLADRPRRRAGLAAACDAAAGAAHHLDEVPRRVAGRDLLHETLGPLQAARHRHADSEALELLVFGLDVLELEGRFLDLGEPADGRHVEGREWDLAPGDDLVNGPQGGLHDAARRAEDVGGAG
jgi:hypothetical protein